MSSQHAVIMGGSSGIGLATARELADHGYQITITGRDAKRLEAARTALGGAVSAVPVDAADADAVRHVFGSIGTFDHLVLALSGSKGGGAFAEVALSDVQQGFAAKFFPHFACAQAATPFLLKDGSITFVSAVSARAAVPGTAGLAAINAAVEALVPTLAAELRPLRVNAVSPGVVDTPWWDFLADEQKAAVFADFAAKTPVGRVGRPEDIAQAIGFLIGNGFMTGHTLVIDGGLRLAA